jgi:3-hydroxyisobutyrate dehydrogenase
MKIAWIGTGIMGYPMASHLIDAGYSLTLFNRSIKKAMPLKDKAVVSTSIQETIKDADIIFTMVSLPEDVNQVYFNQGIIEHAKSGAICIDMTTSSPSLAQKIYHTGKSKGLVCFDAPVSGGDVGAKNKTLTIMVGGPFESYKIIQPLLEVLGKTITYVGEAGFGQHMKMTNQIAVANNLLGVVESMSYANAVGLDQTMALHVLSGGAANSWQLTINGPLMIQHDFTPGFMNIHFIKDLKLVLEEAKKSNISLPMVEKVLNMYLAHDDPSFMKESTVAIYRDYIKHP